MDVTEFMQQVEPRRRRSRLLKYKTEIADLKNRGYTDQQIRDWLARNDLDVSREAVRKFTKGHLAPDSAVKSVATATAIPRPSGDALTPPETQQESQAEKMRRRVKEQQQAAKATQFSHDKTGNNIKE
jgi:hypothetical protein